MIGYGNMATPSSITKIHRITWVNHVRLLKYLFTYIIYFLITIAGCYIINFNKFETPLLIFGIMICCFVAPAIVLHFNYYRQAKNLKIYEHRDYLDIYNGAELPTVLVFKDIPNIELYMSANMARYNVTQGWPTDKYNYLKIPNKGVDIVINNLIYPNIKELASKFSNATHVYHETLFAII